MDTNPERDPQAVVETRLIHATHRLGTGLLVDAGGRPSVPGEALKQLRDFLVVNLRHHHETEDEWLWPLIAAAAPGTKHALDELTEEHDRLDAALDRLAGTDDPSALREAAVEVRDSVHNHLAHEEPILFPALREHITPAQWEEFAQRVVATTPPVAGHLVIGFLDEVGTPAEVESVLATMPPPMAELLPALRGQAAADLRVLRGMEP